MRLLGFNGGVLTDEECGLTAKEYIAALNAKKLASISETEPPTYPPDLDPPPTQTYKKPLPMTGTLLGDDSGKNDEGYHERMAQLALISQGVPKPQALKVKRNPRSQGQSGRLSYQGAKIR
jgi:hypothetical protein